MQSINNYKYLPAQKDEQPMLLDAPSNETRFAKRPLEIEFEHTHPYKKAKVLDSTSAYIDLPDDIVRYIIDHALKNDLTKTITNISYVSKSWLKGCTDFRLDSINKGERCDLFFSHAKLRKMEIDDFIRHLCAYFRRNNRNLESLNLAFNGNNFASRIASSRTAEGNLNIFTPLTDLKSLNLCKSSIGGIGNHFNTLTNLQKLDLEDCDLEKVGNLSKLTSLTELNLSGNSIPSSGFGGIEKLTNLRKLEARNNSNELGKIGEIASLTSLDICNMYNPITHADDVYKITNLTNLTDLSMRIWRNDETEIEILNLVKKLPNLEYLKTQYEKIALR